MLHEQSGASCTQPKKVATGPRQAVDQPLIRTASAMPAKGSTRAARRASTAPAPAASSGRKTTTAAATTAAAAKKRKTAPDSSSRAQRPKSEPATTSKSPKQVVGLSGDSEPYPQHRRPTAADCEAAVDALVSVGPRGRTVPLVFPRPSTVPNGGSPDPWAPAASTQPVDKASPRCTAPQDSGPTQATHTSPLQKGDL